MTDPRYPIGKFTLPGSLTPAARAAAIGRIAAIPNELYDAARGLDAQQLDTQYRDGGWTLRQVVHHVADSHVNAYVRCKLTITETEPPVRAYDENEWSKLAAQRLNSYIAADLYPTQRDELIEKETNP